MSSLNKIILIGDLNETPTVKATNAGDSVANFSLAVQRPARADGLAGQVDSIKVVAWREKAEAAGEMAAGALVLVEGRIHTRSYENDEGQRVYVTEVDAKEVKPLVKSDSGGIQTTTTISAQTTEAPVAKAPVAQAPVVEQKPIDNGAAFDFSDDSATLQVPQGELEEDIPF